MPMPSVPDYPMPRPDQVPDNVAPWAVDARRGVLVHDMQNYFVAPFAEPGLRTTLLTNIATLLESARAAAVPVVYTAQPGRMSAQERRLLVAFWGAGMAADGAEREIVASLRPRPGELVLTKWRYSAYFRSNLEHLHSEWSRDQLVVCGVFAHLGILVTTTDALAHDVQAFLVGDAVGDLSEAEHLASTAYVARRSAAVTWVNDVRAAFDAREVAVSTGFGDGGSQR